MAKVNWASVVALLFMALACVALLVERPEHAMVLALLAVATAVLAHLR